MVFAGVDLGGWYGEKTRICFLEQRGKHLAILSIESEAPLTEDRNVKLVQRLGLHEALVCVGFDAPFAVPAELAGKPESFCALTSQTQRELANPYLYDNSARFVYEKLGLKVMAPAGDSIGKLTARMIHLQHHFQETFHWIRDPYLDRVQTLKPISLETYPKATLQQLLKDKVPSYKGENFNKHKARLIEALAPYFDSSEEVDRYCQNDDDFDALLAALSAYLVMRVGYLKPPQEEIAKFTNSFIYIPDL